jgi:hypothetical protein
MQAIVCLVIAGQYGFTFGCEALPVSQRNLKSEPSIKRPPRLLQKFFLTRLWLHLDFWLLDGQNTAAFADNHRAFKHRWLLALASILTIGRILRSLT